MYLDLKRAIFPGAIPEIDIWRAATLLLKRYADHLGR